MNRREITDFIALSINGGKGFKQTLSTLWLVRKLERHAATGSNTGFKFYGWDFESINPGHLPYLFAEIFLAENCFFTSTRPDPLIIDGGVNIGLSVAYFKHLFPAARIIGFEPHPGAFAVAQRNCERNNFRNVELHQAALAGQRGSITLNFIPDEIMASTTGTRLAARGDKPQTVEVPAVCLSDYLNGDVDFLKLDIEGAEQSVLEEAAGKLRNARHIFIEFHWTRGDEANRLAVILNVLEKAGFDCLITSSMHSRRVASVQPFKKVGPVSSLSVFAKRID